MILRPFRNLTDKELIDQSLLLVSDERSLIAKFLLIIIEIESRRLYAKKGYSSTFKYLLDVHHFSESAAAKRLRAARLVGKFPVVLTYIESGKIHLSGIYLIAPHLTAENHLHLLNKVSFQSKAKIETIIGQMFNRPNSPKRDIVKPIFQSPEPQIISGAESKDAVFNFTNTEQAASKEKTISCEPLMLDQSVKEPNQMRISTNIKKESYDALLRLRELTKATSLGEVIEKAVELYLNKIDPLKKKTPSEGKGLEMKSKDSRYISAKLKVAVQRKYGGKCSFVSDDSRRCEETFYLEYDHITPLSQGGKTQFDNLRLLCMCRTQSTHLPFQ